MIKSDSTVDNMVKPIVHQQSHCLLTQELRLVHQKRRLNSPDTVTKNIGVRNVCNVKQLSKERGSE